MRALGQPSALVLIVGFLLLSGADALDLSEEYRRAENYVRQGEHYKAQSLYRKISSRSRDPELKEHADFKLAWTYFLQGRYLSARTAFRQFRRDYPRSKFREETNLFISLSEDLAGNQPPTSVEDSKAALLYRHAVELEGLAQNEEAHEFYDRIARLHPLTDWAELAAYRQAVLLARRFRFVHAKWRMLAQEQRLLATSKSRAHCAPAASREVLNYRENVEAAFRAAVESCERFFRLYPESRLTSHMCETLAAVHERRGDQRQAAKYYEQVVETLGDHPYSLRVFRAKEKLKKFAK